MTSDEYVLSILQKYSVPTGSFSIAEITADLITPSLSEWAGASLSQISFSGSYAKNTAVGNGTDIDLFISLRSGDTRALRDIYQSLYSYAVSMGWRARKQNVSIGITYNGVSIDLVPARIQQGYHNYHSLYRYKTNTWVQTNVALHIKAVRDSGREKEIRAVKVWRNLHELHFPSIYLELIVIQALKYRRQTDLADNFLHVLHYLVSSLPQTRIVDPSNANNIISDDLSQIEKQTIVRQAQLSLQQHNWGQIIW